MSRTAILLESLTAKLGRCPLTENSLASLFGCRLGALQVQDVATDQCRSPARFGSAKTMCSRDPSARPREWNASRKQCCRLRPELGGDSGGDLSVQIGKPSGSTGDTLAKRGKDALFKVGNVLVDNAERCSDNTPPSASRRGNRESDGCSRRLSESTRQHITEGGLPRRSVVMRLE
jgi:hypothetical protein